MIPAISILLLLLTGIIIFLQFPRFGSRPGGKRLDRIKKSPHFRKGKFQNREPTPQFTEGADYFTVFRQLIFGRSKKARPGQALPSVKTDLKALDISENLLIWFGHSSYFLQIDGKRILVDPVFSGSASPLPFSNRAFSGTDVYKPEDMPETDILLLTHDHWDHLDHYTLKRLRPKVRLVICSLGVGAHLESWGYDRNKITELDWDEHWSPESGLSITAVTARHFSGRGFLKNKSLWASFVLQTASCNIFIGGDSGYGKHFSEIGDKFGEFDLAILECGQYNKYWKYIHMRPEEALLAAKDLKAQKMFPVHHSKFVMSGHPWKEPLERLTDFHESGDPQLLTPLLGEVVQLRKKQQEFSHWWKEI